MGIKKRRQLKFKAEEKRKKRRVKLKRAGKNPDEIFYSGIFTGDAER